MKSRETHINPGKAGPKGALGLKRDKKPSSGPPGNEGGNTRRDFVQLGKRRKGRASSADR
jgi:hypothetical protein